MKHKRWSGFRSIIGWKGTPVLVFAYLICVLPRVVEANAVNAIAIPETAATEGATTPYLYPPMDPANTLAGEALIAALRNGGYVLYMRHTETGTITPECRVSNLTPRGERDAARVGKALQTLAVPLYRIASSPVCRVQDTARSLGLGPFEVTEDLSNVPVRTGHELDAARGRLLATKPPRGKNFLLVGHLQSGNTPIDMIYLDFGEIIAFKTEDNGERKAVARVRVDEWAILTQQNNRAVSGR